MIQYLQVVTCAEKSDVQQQIPGLCWRVLPVPWVSASPMALHSLRAMFEIWSHPTHITGLQPLLLLTEDKDICAISSKRRWGVAELDLWLMSQHFICCDRSQQNRMSSAPVEVSECSISSVKDFPWEKNVFSLKKLHIDTCFYMVSFPSEEKETWEDDLLEDCNQTTLSNINNS